MGSFLDKPKADKNSNQAKNDICSWGSCEMQGWRASMEDAYIAEEVKLHDGETGMLFGVMDGHGGKDVAEFSKKEYKNCLINR